MAEPVRVTHLITSLDQGGAEASLAKLLASMDPGAFSHRVICLLPPGVVAEDVRRAGAPVDSLRLSRGVVAPLGMPRLLRLLRAERPHVLQTWLYHADFLGLVAGECFESPWPGTSAARTWT
ncbi:hypothetical protein [Desulfohalovibrio reitneri]|uniref:hypothetical protein n=1 Tax=Desulfohalovibrio reitneri TaxID=1307759 RepID=UPI000691B983|nr:hypothetical protein [Desulfohalovibrio reitneri]